MTSSRPNPQEINFIVKFLWFCSGANIPVLKQCQSAQGRYATIGFTILITAIMASLSGGYGLWTIFNSTPMAVGFGAFWGLVIGNLDRFLVSTIRKEEERISWGQGAILVSRVAGAIAIGFVVAKPLELKIFEKPINVRIEQNITKKLQAANLELDNLYNSGESGIQTLITQKKNLQSVLNDLEKKRNKAKKDVLDELTGEGGSGKDGAGPYWEAKKQYYEGVIKDYADKQKELNPQIAEIDQKIQKKQSEKNRFVERNQQTIVSADDLITRMETLEELGQDKPIIKWSSGLITFILIFIDVTPILAKILSHKDVYDVTLYEEEKRQKEYNKQFLSENKVIDTEKIRNEADIQRRKLKIQKQIDLNEAQSKQDDVDEEKYKKAIRTEAIKNIPNHPEYKEAIKTSRDEVVRNIISKPSGSPVNPSVNPSKNPLESPPTTPPNPDPPSPPNESPASPENPPVDPSTSSNGSSSSPNPDDSSSLSNYLSTLVTKVKEIPKNIFSRKPSATSKKKFRISKKLGAGILVVAAPLVWIGVEGFAVSQIPIQPLPLPSEKDTFRQLVIYDRNKKKLPDPQTHHELDKVGDYPRHLRDALITAEDRDFHHPYHEIYGINLKGMLRAIWQRFKGHAQGGSTLTQQLAKKLFLEGEATQLNPLQKKIQQILLAVRIESTYTKDVILIAYLNRIYLGQKVFGFEDASQFYFHKSAKNLSLAESATLVKMLPQPNRYYDPKNPKTLLVHNDELLTLRNKLLDDMSQAKKITQEEADKAKQVDIQFKPQKAQPSFPGAYLYNYLQQKELKEILGEPKAKNGYYIIESSLDTTAQSNAEKVLKDNINKQGRQLNYSQGALVTIDSSNGEILALVGGVDYSKSQLNRTLLPLPPASTFKLFTYTEALRQTEAQVTGISFSPTTLFSCDPPTFEGKKLTQYPCERSKGNITMKQGLAQSENPVAYSIANKVKIEKIVDLAQQMGISFSDDYKSDLNNFDHRKDLVIGQGKMVSETNALEMTAAYAAIANRGIWNKPHAIRRILDRNSCENYDIPDTCDVIYPSTQKTNTAQLDPNKSKQVVSPTVAKTMLKMLRAVVAEGLAQGAKISSDAEGKTGTSTSYHDLWFIGMLHEHQKVTGVWLGNDCGSKCNTKGKSSHAAELWAIYMKSFLK